MILSHRNQEPPWFFNIFPQQPPPRLSTAQWPASLCQVSTPETMAGTMRPTGALRRRRQEWTSRSGTRRAPRRHGRLEAEVCAGWGLEVSMTHRIHGAGIYANIWGILMVNVTIYSIHGSYGMRLLLKSGMIYPWEIHGKSYKTKRLKEWFRGTSHFRKPPNVGGTAQNSHVFRKNCPNSHEYSAISWNWMNFSCKMVDWSKNRAEFPETQDLVKKSMVRVIFSVCFFFFWGGESLVEHGFSKSLNPMDNLGSFQYMTFRIIWGLPPC